MVSVYFEPINIAAVFGCIFAVYLLVNIESLARSAAAFVRGVFNK